MGRSITRHGYRRPSANLFTVHTHAATNVKNPHIAAGALEVSGVGLVGVLQKKRATRRWPFTQKSKQSRDDISCCDFGVVNADQNKHLVHITIGVCLLKKITIRRIKLEAV